MLFVIDLMLGVDYVQSKTNILQIFNSTETHQNGLCGRKMNTDLYLSIEIIGKFRHFSCTLKMCNFLQLNDHHFKCKQRFGSALTQASPQLFLSILFICSYHISLNISVLSNISYSLVVLRLFNLFYFSL